ncbi:hypothetical protein [Phocaeicola dorei]|jgi:hypothetical protein|uniref:hypothetical protein n=1 Tax=Phocaeicola dorei TaxID=357276 RepID=UPI0032EC822D
MNKLTKYTLLVVALLLLLGIAGRCDYNESVIYNMPDNVYQVMKVKLDNPSDSRLVDEYVNNRNHWDSIANEYQ